MREREPDPEAAAGPAPPGIERSLRLLPFWWVLRWAWLGEAIWVIYLIETRGLTVGQVLLFDAIFFGSQFLAEVPTGIVADRCGRRASLLAGSLFASCGLLVFGLADPLPLLLTAYVLFGVAAALMSGADDAYLFDALRAAGRGREFAAVAGRLNGTMTAAIAGFTVIGGLMAAVAPLSWPIVASGILSLAAAGIAWRLEEPPRRPGEGGGAASFLGAGLSAGRRVLRTPALRWVVLLAALPQIAGFVVFTAFQPLLVGQGAPVSALGWAAAAMMLVAAAGGWTADACRRRLGVGGSLLALPALGALALAAGGSGALWLFPLLALAPFAQNALHPVAAAYVSRRVPDAERATALSFEQFAAQIGAIAVMLSLGALVDRTGLEAALAGAGAALLAIAAIACLLWRRAGDRELAPAADASPPGPAAA